MATKPCSKVLCGGVMRTTMTDFGVRDQRHHEIPFDMRYTVMKCPSCGHVEEMPLAEKPESK